MTTNFTPPGDDRLSSRDRQDLNNLGLNKEDKQRVLDIIEYYHVKPADVIAYASTINPSNLQDSYHFRKDNPEIEGHEILFIAKLIEQIGMMSMSLEKEIEVPLGKVLYNGLAYTPKELRELRNNDAAEHFNVSNIFNTREGIFHDLVEFFASYTPQDREVCEFLYELLEEKYADNAILLYHAMINDPEKLITNLHLTRFEEISEKDEDRLSIFVKTHEPILPEDLSLDTIYIEEFEIFEEEEEDIEEDVNDIEELDDYDDPNDGNGKK